MKLATGRVQAAREFFFNRDDVLAVLAPWGKPSPVPIRNEAHLLKLLRAHLEGPGEEDQNEVGVKFQKPDGGFKSCLGTWLVGSYCPKPVVNLTKWLCIDVDGGGHKARVDDPDRASIRIMGRAKALGIDAHLEKSKSAKGWHIWTFFEAPVEAKLARALGLALCPADIELDQATRSGETLADPTRNRGLEVFPKQIDVKEDGFGNMVWLPWFHNNPEGGGMFFKLENDQIVELEEQPETFSTNPLEVAKEALSKANGWRKDDRHRASMKTEPIWKEWRSSVVEKIPLESVYGTYLTGKKVGADGSWLECRDPWSDSGDQNPSAGVSLGTGKSERGRFHSFLSERTLSIFDFMTEIGQARNFVDAMRQASELSGVVLPVLERDEEGKPKFRTPSGNGKKGARDRAQISTNDRDLHDLIEEGWRAIVAYNHPENLFRRSGRVVELVKMNDDTCQPITLEPDGMAEYLSRAAQWVRFTNSGPVSCFPSDTVSRRMAHRADSRLPPLDQVTLCPFFDPSGILISDPGYHASARTWFDECGSLKIEIPQEPNVDEMVSAVDLISSELLGDFPFLEDSDRAHAIGALLVPFVRPMIDGPTPFHLVESPSSGAGKTMIADLASILATGAKVNARNLPWDDDELRKMILADLLAMPTIICFDNLPSGRELKVQSLVQVLTADKLTGRALGQSRMESAKNRTLWMGTGINPRLSREFSRRCVRIRIDPGVEKPDLRDGPAPGKAWRHFPLERWAISKRRELVEALLLMVRYWISSGRQKPEKRLSSFEDWSDVIGGVLFSVGLTGFLGAQATFYEEADSESGEWAAFVEQWASSHPDPVSSSTLSTLCEVHNLLQDVLTKSSARENTRKLGQALQTHRDQIFGSRRIRRGKVLKGTRQWLLETLG